MVRRGAAAARDPNAPPAHEMEVHGLENPPRLLARLAGGISAFARNVRDGFRRISGTRFQEIQPIGYPPRESATKNIPGLFQPVRIDRFPWIDINDPATLNHGPAEAAISQGIEDAQQHGLLVDDIDPDRYTEYRNEYFTRYIVKPSMEFFYDAVEYQAGQKPDNRFPSSEFKHASSRQAAIELLFDNTSESKQKRLNTPKKRSNAPAMLTYDEWLAREHSFHRRLWAAERLYDQAPADTNFIARDKNNIPVLAVFPNWLEDSYGREEGNNYLRHTTKNLHGYAYSQPPPVVDDCRHTHHKWWVEQNPHLQPPHGRCGVYHWGTWPELGKRNGPVLTKDTLKGGTRSNPKDGSYAMRYRTRLLKSLGPLTQSVDLLFQIIDPKTRHEYAAAYKDLDPAAKVATTRDGADELFPLRAVLINSLTEEHVDSGDWAGGWAWIGVFGDFAGGDFCLPQLGIRVPMPPESIVGIRGSLLRHFVSCWKGERYSVVHFFKQSLRSIQSSDCNDAASQPNRPMELTQSVKEVETTEQNKVATRNSASSHKGPTVISRRRILHHKRRTQARRALTTKITVGNTGSGFDGARLQLSPG